MKMGMKYLVVRYADTTIERLYLFPEAEQHKDFAARLPDGWRAIRGGYVCYHEWMREEEACKGKSLFQIYGEAFSLGLLSDKEKDLALLMDQVGKD